MKSEWTPVFIYGLVCAMIGASIVFGIMKDNYKKGYIEGATGQPGYDLVTHGDGSKTWEPADKLKGQVQ